MHKKRKCRLSELVLTTFAGVSRTVIGRLAAPGTPFFLLFLLFLSVFLKRLCRFVRDRKMVVFPVIRESEAASTTLSFSRAETVMLRVDEDSWATSRSRPASRETDLFV